MKIRLRIHNCIHMDCSERIDCHAPARTATDVFPCHATRNKRLYRRNYDEEEKISLEKRRSGDKLPVTRTVSGVTKGNTSGKAPIACMKAKNVGIWMVHENS
jgi:hypothetical protein